MLFDQFIERLHQIDLGAPGRVPPRENVLQLQTLLHEALADDEFAVDCVSRQLNAIHRGAQAGPFHIDEPHNCGFRFPHWAPHLGMSPHEHNEWIVSAVVHNSLTIFTYEYSVAQSERRLQPRNSFAGQPGLAGHIYDRGIHNPWNKTNRWSTSFHIYSLGDKPRLQSEVGSIEGLPDTPVLSFDVGSWKDLKARSLASARAIELKLGAGPACLHDFFSQYTLRGALEVLLDLDSPRVPELLRQAYLLSDLENRKVAAEAMKRFETKTANRWFQEIAPVQILADEILARIDSLRASGNTDLVQQA